jgi:hypothetical protein
MLAGQAEAVEDALWMAANILQESAQVAERLAREAHQRNSPYVALRLEERAREKLRHAEVLRNLLLSGNSPAVRDVEQMNDEEAGGAVTKEA